MILGPIIDPKQNIQNPMDSFNQRAMNQACDATEAEAFAVIHEQAAPAATQECSPDKIRPTPGRQRMASA